MRARRAVVVGAGFLMMASLASAQEPAPREEETARPHLQVLQHPYQISSFYRSEGGSFSGYGLMTDEDYDASLDELARPRLRTLRSPYEISSFYRGGSSLSRAYGDPYRLWPPLRRPRSGRSTTPAHGRPAADPPQQ